MEWMLQIVDEIDDALGAVRHLTLGLVVEIGLGVAVVIGAAAMGTAAWMGARPMLVFAAATMFSIAAVMKVYGSQLRSGR